MIAYVPAAGLGGGISPSAAFTRPREVRSMLFNIDFNREYSSRYGAQSGCRDAASFSVFPNFISGGKAPASKIGPNSGVLFQKIVIHGRAEARIRRGG